MESVRVSRFAHVPPEGIVGWYEDLLSRVQKQQPELTPDVQQALASVREYRDWLVANRPKLNHPSAIGLTEYDWFIKNVRLMPYTADDLRVIGDVETSRARTFLKIEQAVNRNLPELEISKSGEEYAARVRQAEELIRSFLAANHLLTIPDYVGPQKTDAFWIQRPGGKRHFWEELQYRDPLVDHIHASLPRTPSSTFSFTSTKPGRSAVIMKTAGGSKAGDFTARR